MSFNLVDLVKDQITDQVTGYIGNMLGGNSSQATSVVDGGVPALLNGLMHTSSTSHGANAMFETIKDTDDGMLDNIGDLLSGDGASSLMSNGTGMLSSLLGGGNSNGGLSNIIDSVSNFSGASKEHSSSIMGLLAPIIFSVIKRKLMGGNGGFNVGSLVDMFTGQKHNIAAAMPQGLHFADTTSFTQAAHNTTKEVEDVAKSTFNKTQEVVHQEKSFFSKLLPLLALLGLGWVGYNMFMKKDTATVVEPAATTITEHSTAVQETTTHEVKEVATQAVETAGVNVEELGQNVGGTMKSIVTSLGGITDVDSAKAAVSTLTESTDSLGNYAGMLEKIPAPARATVIKYATNFLPQVQDLLNKVGSIPGVGAIIKPVVENLNSKLALFK